MSTKTKKMLNERIELYINTIKKLPLDSYKKDQLSSNFIMSLRLMETLANRNLLFQDVSNVLVIVLSALVPVFINYSSANDIATVTPNHLIWATILSVALAIFNALRQSYKFREKWQNYRHTAELLLIEGQNYFALSGAYIKYASHDEGFPYFISAVSSIRINQMNEYLKTANSESDSSVQQRIQDEVNKQATAIQKKKEEVNKVKEINKEIKAFVKGEPAISYDETDHKLKLITFYVNDASYKAPEKFSFRDNELTDLSYRVVTKHSNARIHNIVSPSTGIKNVDADEKDFGSAGCFCVQNGKVVFVSCYHVVKHRDHDWDLFISGSHDKVMAIDNKIVGTILEGAKTDKIDAAIVAISDSVHPNALFPGQLPIKRNIPYLTQDNYWQYEDVCIWSRTRGYKKIKGIISAIGKPVTLDYGMNAESDYKNLDNMILVHSISTEPFSITGDSGSLVYTSDGYPVGIIVGGDGERCSFVIPFSTIANHFNLSIL